MSRTDHHQDKIRKPRKQPVPRGRTEAAWTRALRTLDFDVLPSYEATFERRTR